MATARFVFRDFVTDGVPSSGESDPKKPDIRLLLSQYEAAIAALTQSTGAVLTKASKADIDAVAGEYDNGDVAIVFADPDEGLRGVYKLTGGVWIKQYDLPSDVAQLAADAAMASRDEAKAARDEAVPAASLATTKAEEAQASAAIAAGYASMAGISRVFATKAEANSGLASVAANAFVQVLVDEGEGNVTTVYQKVSSAYVLKAKQGRKEVRPEDFGAIGNGSANDRTALAAAVSWVQTYGGRLRLMGGANYNVGSANPPVSLGGITIDREPGSVISGNRDMTDGALYVAPMDMNRVDPSNTYRPLETTSKHKRPLSDKEVFFDGIQPDTTEHVAINCIALTHDQVVWNTGDIFTPVSPVSVAADQVEHVANPGNFRGSSSPMRGTDELSAIFSTGEFVRAALIKTSHGYHVVYASGMGGMLNHFYKKVGVAAASISTNIDWPGRGDHQNWYPGFANWTIVPHGLQTFSIMLNGVIIYTHRLTEGFMMARGFYALSDPAVNIKIFDWVLARGTELSGIGHHDIVVFGDSTIAPYHGDAVEYLRELLEHSNGGTVLRCRNLGVDGSTTTTMLSAIMAADLSGVTVAILNIGINNGQNAIARATTKSDILAAIDWLQARNIKVVINLPEDIYPKALSGFGVVVFNEALIPAVRQLIHNCAALRGCKVVNLVQNMKPALAYEAQTSPVDARYIGAYRSGKRDGPHNGMLQYRKKGWSDARGVLGTFPRKRVGFDAVVLPAHFMLSTWTSSVSAPLKFGMTDDRWCYFQGKIKPPASGGLADGTAVVAVPLNAIISDSLRFVVETDGGTECSLILDGGVLKIAGIGSDTSEVTVAISWRAP